MRGERRGRKGGERRGRKRGTLIDGAMHRDCGTYMCVHQPTTNLFCSPCRCLSHRAEIKTETSVHTN